MPGDSDLREPTVLRNVRWSYDRHGTPLTWLDMAARADTIEPYAGFDVVEITRLNWWVYSMARAVTVGKPRDSAADRYAFAVSGDPSELMHMAVDYLTHQEFQGRFDASSFLQTPELVADPSTSSSQSLMARLNPAFNWLGVPAPESLSELEFASALPFLHAHPVGRTSKSNAATSVNSYPCLQPGPDGGKSGPLFMCARVLILGDTLLDVFRNNVTESMFTNGDAPSWESPPGIGRGSVDGPLSYHTRLTARVKAKVKDGRVFFYSVTQGDCYGNPSWDVSAARVNGEVVEYRKKLSKYRAVELLSPTTKDDISSPLTAFRNESDTLVPIILYVLRRDGQSTLWKGQEVVRLDIPAGAISYGTETAQIVHESLDASKTYIEAISTFSRILHREVGMTVSRDSPSGKKVAHHQSCAEADVESLFSEFLSALAVNRARTEDQRESLKTFFARLKDNFDTRVATINAEFGIKAHIARQGKRRVPSVAAHNEAMKVAEKIPGFTESSEETL